jgi:hypothetical protein
VQRDVVIAQNPSLRGEIYDQKLKEIDSQIAPSRRSKDRTTEFLKAIVPSVPGEEVQDNSLRPAEGRRAANRSESLAAQKRALNAVIGGMSGSSRRFLRGALISRSSSATA